MNSNVALRGIGVLALTFAVACLLTAPAAAGTVVNSKHDLRAAGGGTPTGTGLIEVCVVCHSPHQAASANSQYPLWNHTGTGTASFGAYSSPTMNATPTNIGGAGMGAQSATLLCMSCHDGTVSVLSMLNPPNSGTPTVAVVANRVLASGLLDPVSGAMMGTSLTNDHPVNFTYNTALATADGGLKDPAVTPAVSALLTGGTMQCSSCHEVHDPTNVPFLVMSNSASALCTTCHNK